MNTHQSAGSTMTSIDTTTIVLGASALIVTVMGVLVGALAIIGFATFRRSVREAVAREVKEQIEKGPARTLITNLVDKTVKSEFENERVKKIIIDRIDVIKMNMGANGERSGAGIDDEAPFKDA